ncbi:MAG: serine/threonine-protein kinase [Polyangiaceae bacterium]
MLTLRAQDDELEGLAGAAFPSESERSVSFTLAHVLGIGGMSVAFLATRAAKSGEQAVVVKVMRPWFARQAGSTAQLILAKEVTALRRLNEQVPPTPFVIRYIDAGMILVLHGGKAVHLPWIAVEYVHGGQEGTTLTARVETSVKCTGSAFDPSRAARLTDSLASGVQAIHSLGILHRDLKPDNILCCGFGDREIFKISDFGVARPGDAAATFGSIPIGTPGYAPMEQAGLDPTSVGTWSDVFSLAAVLFFALTGEDYFQLRSPAEWLLKASRPERRSILDAPALSAELRARESACRAIDAELARATAKEPHDRPRVENLAATINAHLRADSRRGRAQTALRLNTYEALTDTRFGRWKWAIRNRPDEVRIIRSVAWDGDGKCLAVTNAGLVFWSGTEWLEASTDGLPNPGGLKFVRRLSAGTWFVGGDEATVAVYSGAGVEELIRGPDPSATIALASGELRDLGVLVATRPDAPPELHAAAGGRWVRPVALEDVAMVTALARVGDDEWLVGGRTHGKQAYVGLYKPLWWHVEETAVPGARAVLAAAGSLDRRAGIAAATDGRIGWLEGGSVHAEIVEPGRDLSAAAIDVTGRGWVAAAGCIWLRKKAGDSFEWVRVWEDPAWSAPFVSLFADVGRVIAVSADGGILEGRAEAPSLMTA